MTYMAPVPRSAETRFWNKVEKTDTCWFWHGWINPKGYGRFWIGGKDWRYVHRYAYETLVGPIPEGLVIDHLCRTRNCVNPDHLEPVTVRENVLRGAPGGFGTNTCRQGHEFSPENTYIKTDGRRKCRSCMREGQRRRRATLT